MDETPTPKSKKKIVILAAVLLALVAGGGGAFLFLKKPKEPVEEIKEETVDITPAYMDLPMITVGFPDDGRTGYLRIQLKIEIAQESVEAAKKFEPRIISKIQHYLGSLDAGQLRGSSGSHKLQIDLIGVIQSAAPNVEVKDVLIQNMIIQ